MTMQPRKFLSFLLAIFFSLISINTFSQENLPLQNQRTDVIKQYVKLLGDGNYQAISDLFAKNALAISSSGVADNPSHFYKTLFTKTITSPVANLINIFEGRLDRNMMVGYFNYSWKNQEGKQVSAKFLDLFIFQENATKIKSVFVFSNTFQEDIMKQLE